MDKQNKSDIVIYDDGELELNVSINNETVWLNRNQISELFGRDVKTIGKHIANVFSDGELEKSPTVANFATVQNEGELEKFSVVANFATTASDGKIYNVEYYNLDVIISVGYRVKSQKGVKFRQWATSVLKRYISDGYVINSEKITNQRFKELEKDVLLLKSKVDNISTLISDNSLKPSKGIFFDGEVYDAYVFVNSLLKNAKNEVLLIDNYIDDSVLTLCSKYPNLKITIYTQAITKQLKLDYQKYKVQYQNVELKEFKNAHDRFMIIDNAEIYHIGASLKDLGKKWFAFSKFEIDALDILERLK